MRIAGRGFGPVGVFPPQVDLVSYSPLGINYTFLARHCFVSVSDVEITCLTAPGVGKQLTWSVIVAGQRSSSPINHYSPPSIASI